MFTNFLLNRLNSEAASPKNKPSEIVNGLNLHVDDVIGYIGVGGGFFTLEFSRNVGKNGRVYAIDTKKEALEFIGDKAKEMEFNNINTILVHETGLNLPEKVDLFFLRNVFHHLKEPENYFKGIIPFLKDDGKIAVVDYKKKGFSFMGLFGHFTPEEVMMDVMEKAGYRVYEKFDFLDEQSFIILKLKNKPKYLKYIHQYPLVNLILTQSFPLLVR